MRLNEFLKNLDDIPHTFSEINPHYMDNEKIKVIFNDTPHDILCVEYDRNRDQYLIHLQ